ncbi:RNA ligase family protein [Acidovorax sp. Root275]|uniref:RNA ligase family protein n=1 Tax=Acidovorax sp. Root275 TaxID=1736508 RepID=UPI0009E676F4|nr:RNA ligase family protein [Acidovorax sp. Root275]
MDGEFFRFPHTPHLAWLGRNAPRDDKILSPTEAQILLASDVVVEEKLDGANLGFSLASDGALRTQNRGQYLAEPHVGQFSRLPSWLTLHGEALRSILTPNIVVFGEWCAARHTLDYAALPDWFLLFDVYDRRTGHFWSSARRNALARSARLATVPRVACGRYTVDSLKELVVTRLSHYRKGPLEGVVIRRESAQWCELRAKLVRADFTQAIETHWRKRTIEWNRVCISREVNNEP